MEKFTLNFFFSILLGRLLHYPFCNKKIGRRAIFVYVAPFFFQIATRKVSTCLGASSGTVGLITTIIRNINIKNVPSKL